MSCGTWNQSAWDEDSWSAIPVSVWNEAEWDSAPWTADCDGSEFQPVVSRPDVAGAPTVYHKRVYERLKALEREASGEVADVQNRIEQLATPAKRKKGRAVSKTQARSDAEQSRARVVMETDLRAANARLDGIQAELTEMERLRAELEHQRQGDDALAVLLLLGM